MGCNTPEENVRELQRDEQEKLTQEQKADNLYRIKRGWTIIERYRKEHDKGEDVTTVVTDLLADLMHAMHGKKNWSWQDRLEMAREHYRAQLAGED